MTTKPPCPKCGSELILDITYGYPSPEAFEDKSFFSGGCCLESGSPAYHCKSCGHEFGYAIPDDENNIRHRELRKLFENNIEEWDKICSDYDYYDHKESYAKAFSIALDAYANKHDMGGDKYINHSLIIMDFFSIFEERIVALLHNVVKDSAWTLQKIKEEGFSDEIIEAIDSITIRESEDYYDFIDRIKMNKIGFRVKLADLGLKMSLKRTPNPTDEDLVKIKKYKETADILIKYHNKA